MPPEVVLLQGQESVLTPHKVEGAEFQSEVEVGEDAIKDTENAQRDLERAAIGFSPLPAGESGAAAVWRYQNSHLDIAVGARTVEATSSTRWTVTREGTRPRSARMANASSTGARVTTEDFAGARPAPGLPGVTRTRTTAGATPKLPSTSESTKVTRPASSTNVKDQFPYLLGGFGEVNSDRRGDETKLSSAGQLFIYGVKVASATVARASTMASVLRVCCANARIRPPPAIGVRTSNVSTTGQVVAGGGDASKRARPEVQQLRIGVGAARLPTLAAKKRKNEDKVNNDSGEAKNMGPGRARSGGERGGAITEV